MVEIARRYFALPDDDERLATVVGDGGAYIEGHPGCCDVIVLDAYDARLELPPSLAGREFYGACREALRPGGVLSLNAFRWPPSWRQRAAEDLLAHFDAVWVFEVSPEQQVMHAVRDLQDTDWEAVAKRAAELERSLRLGMPGYVAAAQGLAERSMTTARLN